jgi:hypothetical protein
MRHMASPPRIAGPFIPRDIKVDESQCTISVMYTQTPIAHTHRNIKTKESNNSMKVLYINALIQLATRRFIGQKILKL